MSRRNGSIELLSAISGQLVATIPAVAAGSDSQQPSPPQQGEEQADAVRVHGLHLLWDNEAMGSLPAVLSVTQGGIARLHSPAGGSWEQQRSWQVPDKVCCTAYDPASSRLAVGCQGTELRLFDVTTGELVFAFKGGKPNKGERGNGAVEASTQGREGCRPQLLHSDLPAAGATTKPVQSEGSPSRVDVCHK